MQFRTIFPWYMIGVTSTYLFNMQLLVVLPIGFRVDGWLRLTFTDEHVTIDLVEPFVGATLFSFVL